MTQSFFVAFLALSSVSAFADKTADIRCETRENSAFQMKLSAENLGISGVREASM